MASSRGLVDMVRLLLDAGADVSSRDENRDSQAHFAVSECVIYYCSDCSSVRLISVRFNPMLSCYVTSVVCGVR